MDTHAANKPMTLKMLSSERPRNVGWKQAAGLLFGDWGTSRLYVLGIAFLVAGRSSFWLICAMSVLILVVGWAYTHICRIYADGGGVYTAARQKAAVLGVLGALLLFADYTITASLSAVDAFHYFGLGQSEEHVTEAPADARLILNHKEEGGEISLWSIKSPGLWAIVAICVIGAINLLGPKHTAGPAMVAAAGMMVITVTIVAFALPQIHWSKVNWGTVFHPPIDLWEAFVAIVLALSGVEAIASLTGTMHKPVFNTSRKAIWLVASEVAIFNILLAIIMIATQDLGREGHKEDMLAFLARTYIGPWGEWPVRIIGGLLLLSAANTAIGAITSTVYVMSRDGEIPRFFQILNSFGAPMWGALLATSIPVCVLLVYHDLVTLSHLYAIGIVGAVAINCLITTLHPRLRGWYRKGAMFAIGLLLTAIWVTLAATKIPALVFVAIVITVGLTTRTLTQLAARRRPKPSLLRQAIQDLLTPADMTKPKILLGTYGSDALARPAIEVAKEMDATLVVCFIRQVSLSMIGEGQQRLTIDNDIGALKTFSKFLEAGHEAGVPVLPVYDMGENPAALMAETAALYGCDRILIGTSRKGALYQLIKGTFQRQIESLLPPEVTVQVVATN